MTQWHLTQTSLARELGIDPSYISKILKGERSNIKPWVLERLEVIERVGPSMTESQTVGAADRGKSNVRTTVCRQIPVISWAHAGESATYEELPKSWQETVPSTCSDQHAFGLVVEGDSMEPKYPAGTVLVVMPSIHPRNGCLVVAKFKNDGVVFRRFHAASEGVVQLTAYNSIYPPYKGPALDFHWIYPVHSTVKTEW